MLSNDLNHVHKACTHLLRLPQLTGSGTSKIAGGGHAPPRMSGESFATCMHAMGAFQSVSPVEVMVPLGLLQSISLRLFGHLLVQPVVSRGDKCPSAHCQDKYKSCQ